MTRTLDCWAKFGRSLVSIAAYFSRRTAKMCLARRLPPGRLAGFLSAKSASNCANRFLLARLARGRGLWATHSCPEWRMHQCMYPRKKSMRRRIDAMKGMWYSEKREDFGAIVQRRVVLCSPALFHPAPRFALSKDYFTSGTGTFERGLADGCRKTIPCLSSRSFSRLGKASPRPYVAPLAYTRGSLSDSELKD